MIVQQLFIFSFNQAHIISLEKGFNLFCLCAIISMIHGFWRFFLLFPSNKYEYTVTPDRSTHLVFLMVSDENSELLQMPIGKYCDTSEDQAEGLSIFKHLNCNLKIRALSYDQVQRLDGTCYHRDFNSRQLISYKIQKCDNQTAIHLHSYERLF